MAAHDTSTLAGLLDLAKQMSEPELDISSLMGLEGPTYIRVSDLQTVVTGHPEPTINLDWDGDKTLSVTRTSDGGVMATLLVRLP